MNYLKFRKAANNFFFISAVLSITILNSGAGYIGELPRLENISGASSLSSEPIIPIAPKTVPPNYAGVIVNQGKYSQYLKDLDELIPILEDIKKSINNNETDIQMFTAKANTLQLYVNCLKDRYNNKTEAHYESYKQLMILSKNLSETADYWRYTSKYNKLVRGSLKDRETDKKIMSTKLNTALKSINLALDILKENSVE